MSEYYTPNYKDRHDLALNKLNHELGTGLYNPSSAANFILEIPDEGTTEVFRASIQATNLPTVRVPSTQMGIKQMGQTWASIPSATVEYEPVTIKIIMDENWDSYKEIYSWQTSISNPSGGHNTAYDAAARWPYTTIHVLNNERDKIVMSFVLDGAWPEELGGLDMDYTESGHTIMAVTVMLNFKRLQIFDGFTGLEIGPRILRNNI